MALGVVIIAVTALAYVSNSINWRYLNYGPVRFLYHLGALIHESSHAMLCVLTGAKIEKFDAFSREPHVIYRKSKIPIIGNILISTAPIVGGLLFLFLVNKFILGNYFVIPTASGWAGIFTEVLDILKQLKLSEWQSWVMVFLSLNAGAMMGPSAKDLKNIWPALVVLLFVDSPFLASLGTLVLSLIVINILIQIILILIIKIVT